MPKKRNEAILIRSHGGKLVEFKLVPHSQKQGETTLASDNLVVGAMEVRPIPEKFDGLLALVQNAGKLRDLEQMIKTIFS